MIYHDGEIAITDIFGTVEKNIIIRIYNKITDTNKKELKICYFKMLIFVYFLMKNFFNTHHNVTL